MDETLDRKQLDKKMKNLVSIIILLIGLLVGSLFVDVAQLVKGTGFSTKNLSKSDIFEANGKTWVAYTEPAVPVMVINDDACETCDVSEALVWLRRVLPTVSAEKIAYDSKEGKALTDKFNIKTLPAFIFDEPVTKTDFYTQAKVLFTPLENQFIFKTQELGLPVGKYLELPSINDSDAKFGLKADESKAKVIVYSDYQCPYCRILYKSLREVMAQYKDKVTFVYKHLPLDIHPQANNASLAGECALEQNKFWEYSDKLYAAQNEWGATKDTAKFKEYARTLGLNTTNFNKCMDDKKYQSRVDEQMKEGAEFGIAGTPAIFVNDQFESGAITVEQLKEMIDKELNK